MKARCSSSTVSLLNILAAQPATACLACNHKLATSLKNWRKINANISGNSLISRTNT